MSWIFRHIIILQAIIARLIASHINLQKYSQIACYILICLFNCFCRTHLFTFACLEREKSKKLALLCLPALQPINWRNSCVAAQSAVTTITYHFLRWFCFHCVLFLFVRFFRASIHIFFLLMRTRSSGLCMQTRCLHARKPYHRNSLRQMNVRNWYLRAIHVHFT